MKNMRFAALMLGLSLSMLHGAATLPAQAQTPDVVRIYNQGIQAYNTGNAAQALQFFQQATDRYPQYADAWYNMGSIHFQAARYGEARTAFQRAADINPTDMQAKYNLGLTLERLRDNEGAVRVLSQIPVNDKKYMDAHQKIEQIQGSMAQRGPSQNDLNRLSQLSNTQSIPGGANPQSTYTIMDPNVKLPVQTFAKGFAGPTGMAIGPGGFMYVANYSKNAIYKVGATGEKVTFTEGEALSGPIGLAFNAKTNELYAANYLKNNVVRISQDGKVSVMASGLNKPYNLFLDTMNNVLYVSEQETNTVSKIDLPK